jgi:hypothetical protein
MANAASAFIVSNRPGSDVIIQLGEQIFPLIQTLNDNLITLGALY